jgi:large subunit ribosomal protein L21
MATSYAIVETGGKQYRAEKGASLLVEKLAADEGSKVNLRAVMFKDDGDVVLDGDKLEKVKVEAVVAEHVRGPKVRIFKYKPKKGYRRRAGHRQALTRLEVTEVRLLSRKPAAGAARQADKKAEPKAKAEAKPKAPARKAPAKKQPAKKPAAKKTAAKKPAAKKSTGGSRSSSGGRSSSSRRSSSAKKDS